MRKLMWFTLGFGVACAVCAWGFLSEGFTLLLNVLLLASVTAALSGIRWKQMRRISLACVGCIAGLVWFVLFQQVYLLPAMEADGAVSRAAVSITDYSYDTNYGVAADGTVLLEGRPYQIRIYLNEQCDLTPGDTVEGSFRFRLTTPNASDGGTYHSGKGIFLLGYGQGDMTVTEGEARGIRQLASATARRIKDILKDCFPADTYPFAIALLLGDGSELSYETDTAFQISGIRHVIAVSGLHVSILYSLVCLLSVRRRFLTALIGLPVLAAFAALAGFTPSVCRACIMVGLMLLAQVFNREYDGATALTFSQLVMLTVNPMAVTSVSLLLSVASVSGIFLFYQGISGWLAGKLGHPKGKGLSARLCRWFQRSIAVTLSALVLTTPLCAIFFRTVSLVSVLTNLLTLWLINTLFYGIMLVCTLGAFWTVGGTLVAWVISWGIRYVIKIAQVMSSVPGSAVYMASGYIVFWLIFCYVLLVWFFFSKRRQPVVLACCMTIGLCVSLLASWLEPMTDECRVTVMDVGQGQCILLQGAGKNYLVDCGGDSAEEAADIAAQQLFSLGIGRLDGIVVTHLDADHAGGVAHLLTRIQTEVLFLPAVADDGTADALASLAKGEVLRVSGDLEMSCDGLKIRIFGPILPTDSNENSLCVLFSTENCDILITGDRSEFGERMLLRQCELPEVELLIAGHHGSKSSTCDELLEAVQPETVAISVGADNRYGHPAAELLQRLADFGCSVYRTDLNGTIIYRR